MRSFFTLFFDAVPWFLPGLVLWVIAAGWAAGRVARRLSTTPPVAFIVMTSFGIALLATTLPTAAALEGQPGPAEACDLTRLWVASLTELLAVNDSSRNVVLFMPLGFSLALLPASPQRRALWLMALALPFAIETFQLVTPVLGRGCQSADVVDNLLGLAVGGGIGLAVRAGVELAHGWWRSR